MPTGFHGSSFLRCHILGEVSHASRACANKLGREWRRTEEGGQHINSCAREDTPEAFRLSHLAQVTAADVGSGFGRSIADGRSWRRALTRPCRISLAANGTRCTACSVIAMGTRAAAGYLSFSLGIARHICTTTLRLRDSCRD